MRRGTTDAPSAWHRHALRVMGSDRRVVIAGAGVAALEVLLALRAHELPGLDIHVLAPGESFLYEPVSVAEAFELGEAREFDVGTIIAEQGARRHADTLASVDTAAKTVRTGAGEALGYDELVIALGARAVPALPGALTFRGRRDVPALREILRELEVGRVRRVAFALPPENAWPLPIYELALMAAGFISSRELDARIVLVSCEEQPLELFGSRASDAIKELLHARGILLCLPALTRVFEDGALHLAGGGSVIADRAVALPRLEGPSIPGLPADDGGFIPIDMHGRVKGVEGVYAAGDVTAFPLKQGGLAAQQADAIADLIAHRAGAAVAPRPFSAVIRGLLLTGGAPIYLRAGPGTLRRDASVANERRTPWPAGRARVESRSSTRPLWWPPSKVAGRYLAPYLASARPMAGGVTAALADYPPVPDSTIDRSDALELALLLADYDARWGDHAMALSVLDSAEALAGDLPPEWAERRREWRMALAKETAGRRA